LRRIHRLFTEGSAAGLPDGQLLERFLASGDSAAFAALVERYGPMVLGVCRSVLGHPQDAEDAFQATFLVLVCKARSIRGQEVLAGWLRQVAHRVAVRAGVESARRRACERRAGEGRATDPDQAQPDDGWRPVLHEELARLSDRYRLPLLLCDLEGKTHIEAAEELGCGPATVQRRLTGARALLRSRLIRRGIAPTVGVLAASLGQPATAQVPTAWVEATVRAAGSWGSRAGRLAVGDVTAAAALASQSLRAMMLGQLKAGATAAVFLVALIGVVWKAGLAAQDKAEPGAAPRMRKVQAAPVPSPVGAVEPAEPKEIIRYQGQVLDPDGSPFAGAALYLMSDGLKNPDDTPIRATSGADGRFRFEVPNSDFDPLLRNEPWSHTTLLARAPGLAFGLASADKNSQELTVRLARDDVPVSGRIIDLQGRPVVGAAVTVLSVRTTPNGRLDDYLKALQERNEVSHVESEFLPLILEIQPESPVIPPVRTGVDGRFQITGIGRERVATLHIEGPTIETRRVMVRTRPGPTLRVPFYKEEGSYPSDQTKRIIIYGADFDHVGGATRPIEGVVRDLDTGRPLAGIMVRAEHELPTRLIEYVYAITDAQGRYRLIGLPQGREGHVLAVPPCDFPYHGRRKAQLNVPPDETLPYLRARVAVGKPEGPGPGHLDINLKRGVWATGRILDRDTRKPVRGYAEYFVYVDNPHLEQYPGFGWTMIGPHFTGSDGVFHFVVFPGPGVLAARVHESRYIRAAGLEKLGDKVENGLLMTHPYNGVPTNFNVVAPIEPAPNSNSMTHDLLLESGRSLPVAVLGPDGRPLTATELVTVGLKDMSGWQKVPAGTSELQIVGLGPGRGRTIGIRHEAKRLAGELVLLGDETRPQTVTLQPWGVLTGRVVDADGQPLGGGNVYPVALPAGHPEIGKDGRFRIEGLIPGKSYDLQVLKDASLTHGFLARDLKVGPGETKDLGDITPAK
jgi:RNA polymerase sigma factor (sigma-70 family)